MTGTGLYRPSAFSNPSRRSLALGIGALALAGPASVSAQTGDAGPLDTLVVTPTLTERLLGEIDVSTTVIDALSIDRQQPRELADLLRGQPGIDSASNGGFGKATSLFLRGTSSTQSLLLIDGIRMTSATAGAPSWQFVPPQMLDRVEIVRGPRGVIYGADAVGGVVQAFTRRGDDHSGARARVGAGSFAMREYGAGFGGGTDTVSVQAEASHFETDGIALQPGGDRKGYDNTSLFARVDTRPTDSGFNAGLTLLRSQGNTEFVGGDTDFVHQSLAGRAEYAINDMWTTRVLLTEGRDESDTFQSFGESRFDTRSRSGQWLNILDLGAHEMIVGADYRDDVVRSTTEFNETSRDNVGIFGHALIRAGGVDIQPAVRWDDNEAYGSEWTGGLTLGVPVDARHRLRASVGTAFRAPTFNDLYFPGFSNPDVEPESSRSLEAGITGSYDAWYWDLAVYQTDIDDLIALNVVDGLFLPFNVDEARIRGLEFAAGMARDAWTLALAYSHTDPVDTTTGNRLARRTRDSLRLEADVDHGPWSLGATAVVQGFRYDDAAATERLGGFGLLNLRAGRELGEHWTLRVTLDNALDKNYVTARDSFNDFDFQQPGRAVFVRLSYAQR